MPGITDRIVVIESPQCWHYDKVAANVMAPIRGAVSASQLVTFNVGDRSIDENIGELADVLRDGDRVISPAGDGTGNMVVNACLMSGAEGVLVGFDGYGNFNDYAKTFTSRRAHRDPTRLLTSQYVTEAHPLHVSRDGEHYRYALLYANMGWTATAAAIFDTPEIRNMRHRSGILNRINNMGKLAGNYFAERAHAALPPYQRDEEGLWNMLHCFTTDILAVNGPVMGGVIRSARQYYEDNTFLSSELNVSAIWRNLPFLGRSALNMLGAHASLPGDEVRHVDIDFGREVTIPIHLDGESARLTQRAVNISKDSHDGSGRPAIHIIAA